MLNHSGPQEHLRSLTLIVLLAHSLVPLDHQDLRAHQDLQVTSLVILVDILVLLVDILDILDLLAARKVLQVDLLDLLDHRDLRVQQGCLLHLREFSMCTLRGHILTKTRLRSSGTLMQLTQSPSRGMMQPK